MNKIANIHRQIEQMNADVLHASYSMTIDWPDIDNETKNQIKNMHGVTFYQERDTVYHLEIET